MTTIGQKETATNAGPFSDLLAWDAAEAEAPAGRRRSPPAGRLAA